jgi:putative FmdB family regulatory protein
MPLYEYSCPLCGAEFEEIVPSSRADSVACPACGSKRAERKLSAFAAGGSRKAPPSRGCGPGRGRLG